MVLYVKKDCKYFKCEISHVAVIVLFGLLTKSVTSTYTCNTAGGPLVLTQRWSLMF